MNKKTLPSITITITAAASLLLGFAGASSPVFAADTTPSGVVIAQAAERTSTTERPLTAAPTKPGQITVTVPRAKQPTVTTTIGKKKVSKKADAQRQVVFTDLTPGKDYTFTNGKYSVTSRALTTTTPVTKLTVLTTKSPDSVAVSWDHESTRKTGGADTLFTVTATSGSTSITDTTAADSIYLTGLNPDSIYSFTITPSNAIGPGQSTTATMTVTLRSLSISDQPAAKEVKPAPSQKPAQNSQPAPGPSTKTIYVCPDTFNEAAGGCIKTRPYTYSYLPYTYHSVTTNVPYTYHTVQTGPAPILDSYETWTNSCPAGYNMENYGPQGTWCRLYGQPPTAQVKDAPPAGFTDNGTNYTKTEQVKDAAPAGATDTGSQWELKDPSPTGFTDNGIEYIATADKIAKVVPA